MTSREKELEEVRYLREELRQAWREISKLRFANEQMSQRIKEMKTK
jgi:flagellin-specific chaperone FliS